MIEDFWNELNEGEIHVRDNLQFELKTEFLINPSLEHNIYKQDVFLFIPNSLQINPQTYSKHQFYLDQTNLIRYRTPIISLSELVNPKCDSSPLTRLKHLMNQKDFNFSVASDELKLFGAIFRVMVRDEVYKLVQGFEHYKGQQLEMSMESIDSFIQAVTKVCQQFRDLQQLAMKNFNHHAQFNRHFKYVDEFISTFIDKYFVILLKQLRLLEQESTLRYDREISQLIIDEKTYRENKNLEPKTPRSLSAREAFLYRQGLLNHFIIEALMLKSTRVSLEERHGQILGGMAAGIAMLVYMTLLVWNTAFAFNSFPFVALAVFLYILKDRIKEGFKTLYYKQASRWFPDYSTEISNPKGFIVGKLKENFSFIDSKHLPHGFWKIRNEQFHEELQAMKRHESIMHYKREVMLHTPIEPGERRRELTTIFRLNIHQFLQRASNPFQIDYSFDSYTREISERLLPKIYHINIIINNAYQHVNGEIHNEIKTFRVVVDKGGIKRVEQINANIPASSTQ